MKILLIPIESKFGNVRSIQNTARFLRKQNTISVENTLLLTSKEKCNVWAATVIKATVGLTSRTKRVERFKLRQDGACSRTDSQIMEEILKLIIEDTEKKIKKMIIYVGRREVISVILWAEKNNLYRSDVNRDNVKSGSVISINVTVPNKLEEVRRKRIVKEIFTP